MNAGRGNVLLGNGGVLFVDVTAEAVAVVVAVTCGSPHDPNESPQSDPTSKKIEGYDGQSISKYNRVGTVGLEVVSLETIR